MIIGPEYDHPGKVVVKVNTDWDKDGYYNLQYFWWEMPDGLIRYKIEKILDISKKVSYKAGIGGMRYKVKVRAVNPADDDDIDPLYPDVRVTALYLQDNRWFIPRKTN